MNSFCYFSFWRNPDAKIPRHENQYSLNIRTPEGIVFSQQIAGPVTRFFACFIDQFCIQVVLMLLGMLISLAAVVDFNFAIAFYVIAFFIVRFGYGILLEVGVARRGYRKTTVAPAGGGR